MDDEKTAVNLAAVVDRIERRVMILGRDQRTFSGVLNLRARAYFVFGCRDTPSSAARLLGDG